MSLPTSEQEKKDIAAAQGEMSLVDHLQEFRRRIIICIVVLLITSTASYMYVEDIVSLISAPVGKLYFMNPAEVFFSYLKVAFFAGFLESLPVILYQLWAFILPALTSSEKKLSFILVPSSVLLFFVGVLFSYFFVLPAGIKFFLGFATDTLLPMFSLEAYLSFVISFLLPFGIIFELPLCLLVLAKLGFVSSVFLKRKRKIILVLSFVIAAVISPTPDVFSQTMIAIPIILLYEASIVLVKYIIKK
jgi:sec-independent protein translocase protein TatC